MNAFRESFLGFTFNGIHSSTFGIVRVSDGSRFNENLLPTALDKTVLIPGGDGSYFFGSTYTNKQFSVSFAFDSLTEEGYLKLRSWLGDKKTHTLIFDELPYKTYYAKVTGTAAIKYLPFEEGKQNRVYKGEGTIQFTAYNPYAVCTNKFLDDPFYKDYLKELKEWSDASGLRATRGTCDLILNGLNTISLYNPGDTESDFNFRILFNSEGKISQGALSIENDTTRQLKWKNFSKKGNDAYVIINTRINLIEGYTAEGVKSGNIYNEYVLAGFFFKIPSCKTSLRMIVALLGGPSWEGILPKYKDGQYSPIEYNYYYY